jgi:hypothetical protein
LIHKLPTNPEITHPSQDNAQIPKHVHIPGYGGLSINPEEFIKTLEFRKKAAYPETGVSISKYL